MSASKKEVALPIRILAAIIMYAGAAVAVALVGVLVGPLWFCFRAGLKMGMGLLGQL